MVKWNVNYNRYFKEIQIYPRSILKEQKDILFIKKIRFMRGSMWTVLVYENLIRFNDVLLFIIIHNFEVWIEPIKYSDEKKNLIIIYWW